MPSCIMTDPSTLWLLYVYLCQCLSLLWYWYFYLSTRLFLFTTHRYSTIFRQSFFVVVCFFKKKFIPVLLSPRLSASGVGGVAAEHPAERTGPARDQVKGDAPRLQLLLPRGETWVVVALHRRPQRSDPCLHALPCLHIKRHRRGEVFWFLVFDGKVRILPH